jgi:DNA repair exonuclease SbcCD nuclease subunit
MRFVATADWQLGMTAHFLPPDARIRFQQARFDAVRAIARVATERHADFVLVCGDVFESNHLDRRVLARAFEALREFTVPVWLLPGNHDPLDAASIFDSERFRDLCPEHVHVLRTPGIHQVLPGVEVVAAPWSSKRPLSDLVADACGGLQRCDDAIRVVAGHGATDTLNPARDDPATISTVELTRAIESGCVHVAVLGDRHSTTSVTPAIWYPGAPEVTDRREHDPGNVLVVDVETRGGLRVESVHTGQWRFVSESRHLASADDVDLLRRWLGARAAKAQTAVWLSLHGTLSLSESAELEAVLEEARELFAHVEVWSPRTDLHVAPDEHDLFRLRLTGFAVQTLTDLRATLAKAPPVVSNAQADTPVGSDEPLDADTLRQADRDLDDPDLAQAALGLLYRLAGGAR